MAAGGENTRVVGDDIYELCRSSESVSATLAKDPAAAPGDAWKSLYGHHEGKGSGARLAAACSGLDGERDDVLRRASDSGKWGPTPPSEFFLRVGLASAPIRAKRMRDPANQSRSTTMPYVRWKTA